MPRSTSLTTTILNKRVLRFVDCVKIELDAGTLLYTNYEADLQITSIDGSTLETYKTGQGYLSHSPINISGQAQSESVNIQFDSNQLDSTADLIGPAFANGHTTGAPVTITKVLITDGVAGISYIAFRGMVNNFSIKVTATSIELTVFCGGQFANFDKSGLYGYTCRVSQQKVYPNDTGFNFAEQSIENIRWEE